MGKNSYALKRLISAHWNIGELAFFQSASYKMVSGNCCTGLLATAGKLKGFIDDHNTLLHKETRHLMPALKWNSHSNSMTGEVIELWHWVQLRSMSNEYQSLCMEIPEVLISQKSPLQYFDRIEQQWNQIRAFQIVWKSIWINYLINCLLMMNILFSNRFFTCFLQAPYYLLGASLACVWILSISF